MAIIKKKNPLKEEITILIFWIVRYGPVLPREHRNIVKQETSLELKVDFRLDLWKMKME